MKPVEFKRPLTCGQNALLALGGGSSKSLVEVNAAVFVDMPVI
jgi:hypothetical protein